MPHDPMTLRAPPANRWRAPVWCGATALLLLPAVAMRFTGEVNWTASDFVVMGALLATVCGLYEIGTRLSRSRAFRAASAVAASATFLQVWIDLAVGIYGGDDAPITITLGVLAVAIVGAIAARLRAAGLARAMVATAIAQLAAGAYGLYAGIWQALALGFVLAAMWLGAAHLFRRAAREGAVHVAD
ncbi:hypothetical protein [Lysobacter humi (ex Lee et al. 2017)]